MKLGNTKSLKLNSNNFQFWFKKILIIHSVLLSQEQIRKDNNKHYNYVHIGAVPSSLKIMNVYYWLSLCCSKGSSLSSFFSLAKTRLQISNLEGSPELIEFLDFTAVFLFENKASLYLLMEWKTQATTFLRQLNHVNKLDFSIDDFINIWMITEVPRLILYKSFWDQNNTN